MSALLRAAEARDADRLKRQRRIASGATSDSSDISLNSLEDPANEENSMSSEPDESPHDKDIRFGRELARRRDDARQAKKRRRTLGLPDPPSRDITQEQLDAIIAADNARDPQRARDIAADAMIALFTGVTPTPTPPPVTIPVPSTGSATPSNTYPIADLDDSGPSASSAPPAKEPR
jgi:hypothetical protein